ncbi:MAG: hypothetical protein EXS08_03345 [Planctomycetes bacterium]|nr:hypothetical protein [Planctomycetota bacterium]
MEYRIGKCSQCGAEYQVPASFAHNVARCKLCKGVVHLAPNKGASAAAGGAAKETARPAPAAPGRPPRPAASVEAESAPRPAPARASAAPAPRPAVRSEERAPLLPDEEPLAPRPAPAPAPISRAPLGLYALLGIGLLALVLFLLRGKLFGGPAVEPAPHSDAPAGKPEPAATPKTKTGLVRPPPGAAREELQSARADGPASASAQGDPRSIDLRALPALEPSADTSTAEWLALEEWVAQWLDHDAGPAGELARKELETQGRKAVPALLNFVKRQNLAGEEGRHAGDLALPFLKRVSNGTDFGWPVAHAANGADDYACKLALLEWTRAWQRCTQDVEAWITLARLDELDAAEAARLRAAFGVGATGKSSSLEQGE